MNKLLNKYWITTSGCQALFRIGIGVTAYSEEDMMAVVKKKIREDFLVESVRRIQSIDELEQNHVVPNMEEFISRGIWFPRGYR